MSRTWAWLTVTDHKAIGVRYFVLSLGAAVLGVVLSLLMRFHVVNPAAKVSWWETLWPVQAAGGIMTPELYLSLMTIHGSLMVFFVLTLAPVSAFGSYFLPLQLGAHGMPFPRLHAVSFWLTAAALAVMLATFSVAGGGPLSGWTAYAPLSAVGRAAGPGQGAGQTIWICSIGLFSLASLFTAANFIVATLDLRAPGMRWMRMPLPCWSWFITAVLMVPAFSVLLVAAVLLLCDRHLGTSFFVPAGVVMGQGVLEYSGGSPLLWQHLFWFFGHPEVYIAILPAMGIVSQVLSVFARRPVFGYRSMVYATWAIAVLGMLVWGHHMFTSGLSPYSRIAFSLLSLSVGVPSAVKTFNWLATIWRGRIRFDTPMLFALGFVSVFVTGGLSGIVLAQPGLDVYFHDTYFVVAHFHFIMGVSALFGIFAATYYWVPKMAGRLLDEGLGKLHFYLTFAGVHLVFLPMHLLGLIGNPRRYPEFTEFEFLRSTLPVHELVTWGAFATGAVQLVFLWNLGWNWRRGKESGADPWGAPTLEWAVPSPPPATNFPPGVAPAVLRGAYEYSTSASVFERQSSGLSRLSDGGVRVEESGLIVLGTMTAMWFAGLWSALLFRRGMAADWSAAGLPDFLLWQSILLVAAVVLLVAGFRSRRTGYWMAGGVGAAAFVALEALGLGAVQAVGPAAWFFRLFHGSYLLLATAGLVLVMLRARAPRQTIAHFWVLFAALFLAQELIWR